MQVILNILTVTKISRYNRIIYLLKLTNENRKTFHLANILFKKQS